jgi:hypothetical protein
MIVRAFMAVPIANKKVVAPLSGYQYEIRCYIRDPDGHLIEVGKPRTQSGTGRPRIDSGQWRTGATQWAHTRGMRSRGTGTTRALPGSPFNQPPAVAIVASYAMSDRVSHDRYGLGTVVGTENGNAAVLVDFGPKVLRVALPTTKMVKL